MRLRNIKGAGEAVANNPYCISSPTSLKGNWHTCFSNNNPIHIEIGMGKGQFIMALADKNPTVNYIGIERYTSVLLRALQKMEQNPPPNLRFLCIDAKTLADVFSSGEVGRIYLNFSDPWPKDRHAKRRLTSHAFLEIYRQIMAPSGQMEFKTDNKNLFTFSLEELPAAGWTVNACTFDLHHDLKMNKGNIMTEYEEKFSGMGNPIYKLVASP
ncbi:tRNA (guanosine(46)-N7)-methyltransferase TrmB [Lachnospiraceae bacterium]|jgi:tRNA (guanine-N7-)-methyltransferase|nr:tRNA (guanosine(46)-N7)-methyltransferase TrmB [Lachnospiraceae bacterium]